ncbi:hypothetical protein CgunFtcFv8_012379 [Champsocephalus gunnari]|uniref:Uncharacterized protein n=1 Tax=Champsocephalus gunnari TaxID=52237 RepID=A0AAN8D8L1_CHAGU|nr:hypothetical protein CgunFtcFv8_012379 [Champsocephalus gunnari]
MDQEATPPPGGDPPPRRRQEATPPSGGDLREGVDVGQVAPPLRRRPQRGCGCWTGSPPPQEATSERVWMLDR